MSMIREIKHSQPVCEACGQPVLQRSELPPLPPIKHKIFDAVRKRPGISAEELRCIAWANDPAGGPEDRKVLHVHVSQMNKQLAPYGLTVRSAGGGYSIRSVS